MIKMLSVTSFGRPDDTFRLNMSRNDHMPNLCKCCYVNVNVGDFLSHLKNILCPKT